MRASIALVVPVHNGERFIAAALESVFRQTRVPAEVIVVDDGSTDGTRSILEFYSDRIIMVSQRQAGQAAALNAALDASSSEYVAFLDADDEADPRRLELQYQAMQADSKIVMCYTDRSIIDPNGVSSGIQLAGSFSYSRLLQYNFIPRSSVMCRKGSLSRVGRFDVKNSGNDDWDMWLRLAEIGNVCYLPLPLFRYRIHGNNISRTRKNQLRYFLETRVEMLERVSRRLGPASMVTYALGRAKCERYLAQSRIGSRFGLRSWWRIMRLINLLERPFMAVADDPRKCDRGERREREGHGRDG